MRRGIAICEKCAVVCIYVVSCGTALLGGVAYAVMWCGVVCGETIFFSLQFPRVVVRGKCCFRTPSGGIAWGDCGRRAGKCVVRRRTVLKMVISIREYET